MKNRKGSFDQIGWLILVAVGITVALTLLIGSIAPQIGQMTNTVTLTNGSYTTPANGGTIDLVGQELLSTPIVVAVPSNVTINAGNYTIDERVSPTDGMKRIYYQTKALGYNNSAVKITYQYGAEGYMDSAPGRSMLTLVTVLAALAILAFTIPNLKETLGFD